MQSGLFIFFKDKELMDPYAGHTAETEWAPRKSPKALNPFLQAE
jgi:hypothetical protein